MIALALLLIAGYVGVHLISDRRAEQADAEDRLRRMREAQR